VKNATPKHMTTFTFYVITSRIYIDGQPSVSMLSAMSAFGVLYCVSKFRAFRYF